MSFSLNLGQNDCGIVCGGPEAHGDFRRSGTSIGLAGEFEAVAFCTTQNQAAAVHRCVKDGS